MVSFYLNYLNIKTREFDLSDLSSIVETGKELVWEFWPSRVVDLVEVPVCRCFAPRLCSGVYKNVSALNLVQAQSVFSISRRDPDKVWTAKNIHIGCNKWWDDKSSLVSDGEITLWHLELHIMSNRNGLLRTEKTFSLTLKSSCCQILYSSKQWSRLSPISIFPHILPQTTMPIPHLIWLLSLTHLWTPWPISYSIPALTLDLTRHTDSNQTINQRQRYF